MELGSLTINLEISLEVTIGRSADGLFSRARAFTGIRHRCYDDLKVPDLM